MEPVPETERMEEFRPSPLPKTHISSSSPSHHLSSLDTDVTKKPAAMRRSTDPSPTSTSSPSVFSWGPMATLPYRPRTASPLSGTHTRSRSVASLGAPPMGRTQSMPGLNGSGHIFFSSPQFRPASPANSPSRVRTPRKHIEEAFPVSSPVRNSVLDQDGPPPSSSRSSSPILGASANASRLRRPSSPLRNYAQSTGSLTILPTTPSSSSSPLYRAYDPFSSSYSNYSVGAFSSVPSTPTSARSRSPSISSLETIPDSPDAEEAAVEAEKAAQLKAAAEISAEGSDSADGKGRGSLDPLNRGRTMTYGSREKRKRWSVCGAERRGDLDLETIWED